MANGLRLIDTYLGRVLDAIVVAASLAVAGVLLFLVAARYLFGWSVVGMHELALLAAMWLYMTGALIASRRREHLAVDFVPGLIHAPRKQA
jgi:TRAP-type C4-dicarboxylate transport system permease small subunit